ncbi:hypothetical protein EV126DRAFT_236971 [Verticillium dahliae]|nr:hypothetical protein EV126DRAFT_236971 [Verticillium dahliae]
MTCLEWLVATGRKTSLVGTRWPSLACHVAVGSRRVKLIGRPCRLTRNARRFRRGGLDECELHSAHLGHLIWVAGLGASFARALTRYFTLPQRKQVERQTRYNRKGLFTLTERIRPSASPCCWSKVLRFGACWRWCQCQAHFVLQLCPALGRRGIILVPSRK